MDGVTVEAGGGGAGGSSKTVIVLAATNTPWDLDEALRRCVCVCVREREGGIESLCMFRTFCLPTVFSSD